VKKELHIVIAGAGIVGLTLGALLRRVGTRGALRISIIDANSKPDYSFDRDIELRVSAISAGSRDILDEAGAWRFVAPDRICPYADMKVWEASGAVEGPETLLFSAADYALPELGHIVENKLLQDALLSALSGGGQNVRFDTTIRTVAELGERYRVELSDGDELDCDLLVGADGGASFVRKQSGITVRGWSYQQTAVVTHLVPELPHDNTAWQRFLPEGPIALLPLEDGRVSTVWSTAPDTARQAMDWDDDELGDALSQASDHVLGRLTPAAGRATFPLRAQHARQYVKPGLALIGDAAHSVHPLAGQGANLGIADAACLAAVLEQAIAASESIGDYRVLRRYERKRKSANLSMLYFIDGLNRLYARKHPLLLALRSTGMRLFNRSGPIRDYAVRVALGLGR